jgi:hypothetical protein
VAVASVLGGVKGVSLVGEKARVYVKDIGGRGIINGVVF